MTGLAVVAKSSVRVYAISAVAVICLGFVLHRAHFDWTAFFAQLRLVAWGHIAVGVALIYGTYWLRAWRWAEFCRPLTEGAVVGAAEPDGRPGGETKRVLAAASVRGREADPYGMTTRKAEGPAGAVVGAAEPDGRSGGETKRVVASASVRGREADPYGMTTRKVEGPTGVRMPSGAISVETRGVPAGGSVSGREADPYAMTNAISGASGVITEAPEVTQQRRSPVRAREVLGAQFVGFTAVAIFGRLADLARPYLVAKRTGLPVSSQVAVYTVERMFDLGAAAVVFSSALAFTPAGLAHRDRFVRVGVGSLGATLFLALFAVAVRLRGEVVAAWIARQVARFSPKVAAVVEEKILDFRQGLRAISTVREFLVAAAISLGMWLMIGGAYWQTAHAFAQTPELATLSFSRTMLLMAASLGGSLLQLPGLGWFTQIAATAAAMRGFFGAPIEAATACGAVLLCVTSLSIVPAGLLFARVEGISLKDAGKTTEDQGVEKVA